MKNLPKPPIDQRIQCEIKTVFSSHIPNPIGYHKTGDIYDNHYIIKGEKS